MSSTPLTWHVAAFHELSAAELYGLMGLRSEVFVVEQACVYQDADGCDQDAWHLWGTRAGESEPLAYVRILPAGGRYAEVSIGRVVTASSVRREGLGRELMAESLRVTERLYGAVSIKVGAQVYLQRFYEGFGFVRQGDEYDEDGIPHIYMLRAGDAGARPRGIDRSRVTLRPLSEDDVDSIMSWVNDSRVVGNLAAFSGEPFTREQELAYVRQMMASTSDRVYSVLAADDGRYLGQVGLHQIHARSKVARMAIVIGNKAEMGKGFGTAAVAGLLDRAFGEEGLHKVWLMVFDHNERSRRIYGRVGFRVEGRLREEYFHEDGWHTMLRMGLLAKEWATA
jgi:ElaA protein